MEIQSAQRANIWKVNHEQSVAKEDYLAIEEPLQISISIPNQTVPILGKSISITMRTPGNDKALGIGFLFTEGMIHHEEQVIETLERENEINIQLHDISADLSALDRHFYTSSSCGVCGKSSIDAIKTSCKINLNATSFEINKSLLYTLPNKLKTAQTIFNQTGGLHAAAIFNLEGHLIDQQEDVGRHNALDKLIGNAFLDKRLPLSESLLLLSGRVSFELVQKAYMAGVNFIMAVGAPSSLAVQLAKEFDITLVGFLSEQRFNIYNAVHRIKLD